MRHGIGYRKLNKTGEHRKALFKNMLNSLIKYEQIITTLPKAKELKPQIDKVITIGKKNILSNKKRLFSKLQNKDSVTKVFDELSKRYNTRKGGYSRVLKAGFRTGDDAPMAVIELVDRNPEAKKVDKPKKIQKKEDEKTDQKKVASKQFKLYMPKTYTVEKDYQDSRFDKWFKKKIINLPQSLIEKIIRLNKVKVNKKKNKIILQGSTR